MKKFLYLLLLLVIVAFCLASCDSVAQKEHEHRYSDKWTADAVNHYHTSTCGHDEFVKGLAKHDYDEDGICKVCGYKKQGSVTPQAGHEHTYSDTWTIDDVNHYHVSTCGHDDLVKDLGKHDYGEDGICKVCGHKEQKYVKAYQVTFYGLNDEVLYDETLPTGSVVEDVPEDPKVTTEHYHFECWTIGKNPEQPFDTGLPITQDLKIYPYVKEDAKYILTVKVASKDGVRSGGQGELNGATRDLTFEYYKGTKIYLIRDSKVYGAHITVNDETIVTILPKQSDTYDNWMSSFEVNGSTSSKEEQILNGDMVVRALFGRDRKEFEIKWIVDGSVKKTENVEAGKTPSYGDDPVKEGYVFTGWNPAVGTAWGPATYTATFREKVFGVQENATGLTLTGLGDYKNDEVVTVPKTIGGKNITEVATNALKDNSKVKEINLPETITNIASGAFNNCSSLVTIFVDVSSSLIKSGDVDIDSSIISNCNKIYAIMLKDDIIVTKYSTVNLNNIDDWGRYKYNDNLGDITSFILPERDGNGNEIVLYTSAFDGVPFKIISAEYITSDKSDLITNCPNLRVLVIGNLGSGMVKNCPNLVSVVFKGTMTDYSIKSSHCFIDCPKLRYIVCTDGIIDLTE